MIYLCVSLSNFILLTFKGGVFVDLFVIFVFCLLRCLVCPLQPCGHLLGKGWPLGSLECDVFLCFSHFPMCCPGSGLVLDWIDS